MNPSSSHTARIFLSSTFRDFGEELNLLVRWVYPARRSRLKDRFVELIDLDLRWGITVEQVEGGNVPLASGWVEYPKHWWHKSSTGMIAEWGA
jgi:hypothetical protein